MDHSKAVVLAVLLLCEVMWLLFLWGFVATLCEVLWLLFVGFCGYSLWRFVATHCEVLLLPFVGFCGYTMWGFVAIPCGYWRTLLCFGLVLVYRFVAAFGWSCQAMWWPWWGRENCCFAFYCLAVYVQSVIVCLLFFLVSMNYDRLCSVICLCWGFTAQSTQWSHVERGQFT